VSQHGLVCRQAGFTLAEVIVAVSISIVVGALLLGLMINNTGLFYQQSSKLSQGLGINDSLSGIRSSIKEADAVASGYPTSNPTYITSSTALVLQLHAIDSSGNNIFGKSDYVVFTISQNRLYYKVYPDTSSGSVRASTDQILTSSVDSIKFEYFDAGNQAVAPTNAIKIRATLTLKQKAGTGYETNIATADANLRND